MNDYFYALVDRVNGYGYEDMLRVLYSYPFEIIVETDANLLPNVFALRDEYGYKPKPYEKDMANCFEIFISLASKFDWLLSDLKNPDRTEEWFWMMMKNTGLIFYDNEHFNRDDIESICDVFVHRKYKTNGYGGPFPLRQPRKNVRRVDLWYQINWYVNENFEYEFNDIQEEFEDE